MKNVTQRLIEKVPFKVHFHVVRIFEVGQQHFGTFRFRPSLGQLFGPLFLCESTWAIPSPNGWEHKSVDFLFSVVFERETQRLMVTDFEIPHVKLPDRLNLVGISMVNGFLGIPPGGRAAETHNLFSLHSPGHFLEIAIFIELLIEISRTPMVGHWDMPFLEKIHGIISSFPHLIGGPRGECEY